MRMLDQSYYEKADEIIEHYFCSDNGIELVKAY